ncbi:MAG: hypothetical protein ACT6R2_00505 [Blastomonas fulva]|uniref:hypothetical protein n=1 Tax=Blastomonas fulva TaxID=1550728 RepID=UPI0025A4509E|nr:hypothetical protein [Blastomonas fulva]MDM7928735.1 hypothetical protein [Blastomonas fulva]MDM7964521.1 hypothetical protein [Blastomonas fulva]
MTDPAAHVRKQTLISIVITMAISAGFFLAVFGTTDPIAVWAPDNLALDFLPQSGAASFMAALMPALQTRAAIAKGTLPGTPPSVRSIVVRAVLLALLALGLGGVVIFALKLSGVVSFAWGPAFAIKVAYGALLGLIITPPAVRAVLKQG